MSYKLEQEIKELRSIVAEMDKYCREVEQYEFTERLEKANKAIDEELIRRKSGEEAAEYLEHFVNCISMRAEEDKFAEKVTHGTHRTLHQSIIGLMFKTILKTAESERYDGRNEASVMACRKLAPIIKESHLPFI